ncbi:hypothetical protein GCM10011529_01550 [Polymorphobacter glacialis]|uniref:DUF2188 domain-containing protein n=1 Tax=Sandarakinorhabdus glacialis TaxID=1614636 RepID=A0A916ZIM0_9SPHN|nr:DUF2188 domain-containing protein [Polymorphobacter glacialis]GGD99086.1 hypothetical protein GCM10011529_01550 [Polymorphobacter glacialis]
MGREQYFVVSDAGQWRVNFRGNLYGYYPDVAAATAIAIDTAQKAGDAGLEAEVIVEQPDGNFERAWHTKQ